MSVVRARPNSEKNHMRRPCTKEDAPAKQRGIWRKLCTSSRIRTKLRSILLLRQDQRSDMMSKKEFCSEEMDTVKRSRTTTVVLTAICEVYTHEEAHVFVHDLNLFVTVQLLEETPEVLSLEKLCEHHGYSYECVSG